MCGMNLWLQEGEVRETHHCCRCASDVAGDSEEEGQGEGSWTALGLPRGRLGLLLAAHMATGTPRRSRLSLCCRCSFREELHVLLEEEP